MSVSRTTTNADKGPSSLQMSHSDESPTSVAVMNSSGSGSGAVELAPKRANKACCVCRRDKIKCDGARPCAGCLKKGLADESCIDGCIPCRRARARCDGAKPCSNCVESQTECIDDSPSLNFRPDTYSRIGSHSAKHKITERAKLACLACRRDNKKCDDQRPCKRCKARSEDCVHIARGPKNVKTRCKRCREENHKCEDLRPCKYCEEAGEACSDIPRKGRGHGQRVKAACIHCRKDKIQCDTERPCRGCVRRGLQCLDRTCTCAEKGKGHECAVCRARNFQNGLRGQSADGIANGATDFMQVNMQPDRSAVPESPLQAQASQVPTQLINRSGIPSASSSQHVSSSLLEALTGLPVGSFPSNMVPAPVSPMPNVVPKYNIGVTSPNGLLHGYGPVPDHAYALGGSMPMYGSLPVPMHSSVLQQPFSSSPRHLQSQHYIPMIDPNVGNPNQT